MLGFVSQRSYAGFTMFTYVCISWYGRQLITIISHLVPSKKQISLIGAYSLICGASSSNCLSGSVMYLFLTFPMIPSTNNSKGKKARHSSNRSCALGVVAVCARKYLDLDYMWAQALLIPN